MKWIRCRSQQLWWHFSELLDPAQKFFERLLTTPIMPLMRFLHFRMKSVISTSSSVTLKPLLASLIRLVNQRSNPLYPRHCSCIRQKQNLFSCSLRRSPLTYLPCCLTGDSVVKAWAFHDSHCLLRRDFISSDAVGLPYQHHLLNLSGSTSSSFSIECDAVIRSGGCKALCSINLGKPSNTPQRLIGL